MGGRRDASRRRERQAGATGVVMDPVSGNGGNMADKQPTKRTLLLRQRAARAMEKSLPDQVRRAYGDPPSVLADLPSDDPHLAAVRENARASLLKQGYLTE